MPGSVNRIGQIEVEGVTHEVVIGVCHEIFGVLVTFLGMTDGAILRRNDDMNLEAIVFEGVGVGVWVGKVALRAADNEVSQALRRRID